MTQGSKQEGGKTTAAGTDFQQEFGSLPLEEKFSNLWQMEVATLNEAMRYVADSSMKVLEKVGDAISDFGTKVEAEAKKAVEVNQTEEGPTAETASTGDEAKAKGGRKKKPEEPNA